MKKEGKEIEVIEIGEIDLCKVPKDVLDTFIATLEKEIKKAIEDNGYPNILNISASAIEGANIFAMRQEMICDCEFMICARRDELEELKLKINEVAYRIILSQ